MRGCRSASSARGWASAPTPRRTASAGCVEDGTIRGFTVVTDLVAGPPGHGPGGVRRGAPGRRDHQRGVHRRARPGLPAGARRRARHRLVRLPAARVSSPTRPRWTCSSGGSSARPGRARRSRGWRSAGIERTPRTPARAHLPLLPSGPGGVQRDDAARGVGEKPNPTGRGRVHTPDHPLDSRDAVIVGRLRAWPVTTRAATTTTSS